MKNNNDKLNTTEIKLQVEDINVDSAFTTFADEIDSQYYYHVIPLALKNIIEESGGLSVGKWENLIRGATLGQEDINKRLLAYAREILKLGDFKKIFEKGKIPESKKDEMTAAIDEAFKKINENFNNMLENKKGVMREFDELSFNDKYSDGYQDVINKMGVNFDNFMPTIFEDFPKRGVNSPNPVYVNYVFDCMMKGENKRVYKILTLKIVSRAYEEAGKCLGKLYLTGDFDTIIKYAKLKEKNAGKVVIYRVRKNPSEKYHQDESESGAVYIEKDIPLAQLEDITITVEELQRKSTIKDLEQADFKPSKFIPPSENALHVGGAEWWETASSQSILERLPTAEQKVSESYKKQLILQIQGDDISLEAAESLFVKHLQQSEWMQLQGNQLQNLIGWQTEKNRIQALDLPLQLDREGNVRIVLVGHGSSEEGKMLFGNKTAAELQVALATLFKQLPTKSITGVRLDLVGCQLMDNSIPLAQTLPGQLGEWLVHQAELLGWPRDQLSLSARQYDVRVNSAGKKEILHETLGWISKESARVNDIVHKVELRWDEKSGKLVSQPLTRDELMSLGAEIESSMHEVAVNPQEREQLSALHQKIADDIRHEVLQKEAPSAEHRTAVEKLLLANLHGQHQAREWNEAANALMKMHLGEESAHWMMTGETRTDSAGVLDVRILNKNDGTARWLASEDPAQQSVFSEFESLQKELLSQVNKGLGFDKASGQWHLRDGLNEVDAPLALNALFTLQMLMDSKPQKDQLSQASAALQVQMYTQYIQTGMGLGDDAVKTLAVIKSALGADWKLMSRVSGGLGALGSALGPLLDVVNVGAIIAELVQDPNNASVQTKLALSLISSGVSIGALVAGLASAATLSSVLGAIGAPLAGLTIGITALVDSYAQLRAGFDVSAQYFDQLMNSVSQPGWQQQDKLWRVHDHATVVGIDFINGVLEYGDIQVSGTEGGSAHTRTGGWDHYFSRPQVNWKLLLDVYQGFGLNKKYSFNSKDISGAILLPGFAGRRLFTELDQMPGVRYKTPQAFEKLRAYYGEQFVWGMYALPTDWAISNTTEELISTPINIHLDEQVRTLVIPTVLERTMKKRWDAGWGWVDSKQEDESDYLSYTLNGHGGKYLLILPAKAVSITIVSSQDAQESWILDMSSAIRDYQIKDDKLQFGAIKADVFRQLNVHSDAISLGEQRIRFTGQPPAIVILTDAISDTSGVRLSLSIDLAKQSTTAAIVLDQPLTEKSLEEIRTYFKQGSAIDLLEQGRIRLMHGQQAGILDMAKGVALLAETGMEQSVLWHFRDGSMLSANVVGLTSVDIIPDEQRFRGLQHGQQVVLEFNSTGLIDWLSKSWSVAGTRHALTKEAKGGLQYAVYANDQPELHLQAANLFLSDAEMHHLDTQVVLPATTRALMLDDAFFAAGDISIMQEEGGQGLTLTLPGQSSAWHWDIDGSDLILIGAKGCRVKWLDVLGSGHHSAREHSYLRLEGRDLLLTDLFEQLPPVERHNG